MKQKREILTGIFLMLSLIFCLGLVSALESANITVVTPGASGTLSGASAVFNCSVVAGYENQNYTTGYVYLQSASLTANTTETLMATVSNTTAYDFNGTLDSTTVEDGNDYTFKCSLFNGTDYVNATRSGITIDNTIPQAPSITSHSNNQVISTSGTQTFSFTVTDANTTSCTYTIYRGGSSSDGNAGSGTYSGSTCSFTKAFSTSSDNGNWYVTSTASDETNTTASGTTIVSVQFPGSGGGIIDDGGIDGGDEKSSTPIILFAVIIGAVILFILYLLFRKT